MLIKCPECSHQVSDQAETCPSCGIKIAKNPSILKKNVTAKQLIIWIALGAFVFFYLQDHDVAPETISDNTSYVDQNQPPPEVDKNISIADVLNDKCRGGSGDDPKTMEYCEQRDALIEEINKQGWCYGHEPQAMYERKWEVCRDNDKIQEPPVKTAQLDPKPEPKEPEKPTCATDWTLCKTTKDLVNQNVRLNAEIGTACKIEAEKRYNQPIDWGGLFEINFASFLPEDLSGDKKEITMIDDVAMYQNVYGAQIKTETLCRYDLNAKKVVLIMSEPK